jgi:hypothetical protein
LLKNTVLCYKPFFTTQQPLTLGDSEYRKDLIAGRTGEKEQQKQQTTIIH